MFLYLPEGTLLPEWSQGNSHPEEGSITSPRVAFGLGTATKRSPAKTSPASDRRLLRQLFDACTRRWSPRPRLRLDGLQSHNYLTTSIVPAVAPAVPWAIHLADTDHRFRLLAFDLDSSRHGADVAANDARRLCGVLDELGVAHLRTASGPSGGQHVWVRLTAPGAPADKVRELAHALRQHYPSLDSAPLNNPTTGAVRPPGAPHRHGGHSLPYLRGKSLIDMLADMDKGTSPEVVQWLLARHPHSELPQRDHRTRMVRLIDDQAGIRLDRPQRPLTARTRALLSTTPPPGTDRSALAHSILLGMATTGHSLADVQAAVESAPGLARLREDKDRGCDDTARQWLRAVEAAARFIPSAVEEREPIDNELDQIEAVVMEDPTRWARAGGASDERILHALIVLARTARTRTLDIDVRRLAEAAAIDASTVSRRLRTLISDGWVTLIRQGSGTRASTWELNLHFSAATQGEPAPGPHSRTSSALLDHHTHDVWSNRIGLGGVAARIHWVVLEFWKPGISALDRTMISRVVSATGYAAATVTRVVQKLRDHGLLSLVSSSSLGTQMNKVAKDLQVRGAAAKRAYRHLIDRELHRWWLEELAWRTRRGKKRGVAATRPSGLTLPIEASARARYGRFPKAHNGRVDYRTARAIVSHFLPGASVSLQAA